MKELDSRQYPGPNCALQAAIDAGLPVRLTVGKSGYTVTEENLNAFRLGVMFSTDDEWLLVERGRG